MKKNILIVDDSALMRKILTDIVESDSRFNVVDYAGNGLEALELLVQNTKKYDIILLDINMPKMDGLEFLEELWKKRIKTRVIIISTTAIEGAKETIRALELGAFDFVNKPNNFVDIKKNEFKEKVLNTLLLATNLVDSTYIEQNVFTVKDIIKNKNANSSENKNNNIVALACSTGGPKALHTIIPKLPKDFQASIIIVQHMPEGFTSSLAQRLDDLSEIRVKEAKDGDMLESGVVYIAKGGSHLTVQRLGTNHKLIVQKTEPIKGLMPCADLMYKSLIDSGFSEIICVVLTGMGSDATEGIRELSKKKIVHVISQNEETSIVYGMPRAIYNSGLVDEVLPLNNIIDAITNKVGGR